MDENIRIQFDYDKMKLTKIYENDKVKDFPNVGVQTPDSIKVFGELRFPEFPKDRTYTLASFVTSIDGKVAYLDNSYGPIIAKGNKLDQDGADADYWVMTLMRANADAIIAGAGSMVKDRDSDVQGAGLAFIADKALEDERVKRGLIPVPWLIISSLDGTDIPFENKSIKEKKDYILNTSPIGLEAIKIGFNSDYYVVGPYNSVDEIDKNKITSEFSDYKYKKIPVIVTGEGKTTNAAILLRILKLMGINTASVESPSYCHYLAGGQLLDEITLNYSCVYIGGTAIGLGNGMKPNTSIDHPHTEMLSIHTHSPHFFYFRHKFIYGI